jgi:hypothetical protein
MLNYTQSSKPTLLLHEEVGKDKQPGEGAAVLAKGRHCNIRKGGGEEEVKAAIAEGIVDEDQTGEHGVEVTHCR